MLARLTSSLYYYSSSRVLGILFDGANNLLRIAPKLEFLNRSGSLTSKPGSGKVFVPPEGTAFIPISQASRLHHTNLVFHTRPPGRA
jgi:hypothetical protein